MSSKKRQVCKDENRGPLLEFLVHLHVILRPWGCARHWVRDTVAVRRPSLEAILGFVATEPCKSHATWAIVCRLVALALWYFALPVVALVIAN